MTYEELIEEELCPEERTCLCGRLIDKGECNLFPHIPSPSGYHIHGVCGETSSTPRLFKGSKLFKLSWKRGVERHTCTYFGICENVARYRKDTYYETLSGKKGVIISFYCRKHNPLRG